MAYGKVETGQTFLISLNVLEVINQSTWLHPPRRIHPPHSEVLTSHLILSVLVCFSVSVFV